MPRLTPFKTCVSLLAISAMAACASSGPKADAGSESNQQAQLPKPTPEVIEGIKNSSPLQQANFWNQHYNLHPTDLDISLAYIDALIAIKSYDRAAEVAKFSSITFSDNPDVYMRLGKVLTKNNQPLKAAQAYGRVVEISPYDAAPLAALGTLFDSRGDHETAQLAYQKALALDPDRPATLSNLGLSLTLVGKLEQAEEALKKATDMPEATPAIRQNYALVLGLLGKFDEARQIAAIDAPDGIAERNTDFLKNMIGDNPALQAIAKNAATSPANAQTRPPVKPVSVTEAPKAAPTRTVEASALEDVTIQPDRTKVAAATPTEPPKLRLRQRKRTNLSGGGD